MSTALLLLTGFMLIGALTSVVKPAFIFEYPVAACTLMCVFMLPQAWQIERQGDLADFEPSTTWAYMILCMAATVLGYLAGRSHKPKVPAGRNQGVLEEFDVNRLLVCSLVLWMIGGVGIVLMLREAAHMEKGELWTGAIAFYAMIATLFLYGTVICWTVYLHTRRIPFLIFAVIGLIAYSGQFFYGARREGSFVLGITIFLGFYFVRKKMISRFILIPLLFLGTILVNQAGAIRAHMELNNTSIIDALSSQDVIEQGVTTQGAEVSSAVSDISISNWSGEYRLFTPFYNQLVNLYVPAFILGRDFKQGMLIASDEDTTVTRYYAAGSTRTGFADTFQSLHYLGCVIFFLIAYLMGRLWIRAMQGDLAGQIYYMLALSAALKVLTESASSFVGIMPLLLGSCGAVIYFSRKPPVAAVVVENRNTFARQRLGTSHDGIA